MSINKMTNSSDTYISPYEIYNNLPPKDIMFTTEAGNT